MIVTKRVKPTKNECSNESTEERPPQRLQREIVADLVWYTQSTLNSIPNWTQHTFKYLILIGTGIIVVNTSSRLNRMPPMGVPKATLIPAAADADNIW